jgi:hypothetical protein
MKMDHNRSDHRPNTADQDTQCHAANCPDEKLLFINMGARDREGG